MGLKERKAMVKEVGGWTHFAWLLRRKCRSHHTVPLLAESFC